MQDTYSKRSLGNIGEELTAYYLGRSGYKILKRNYAVKGGEIDIIAEKDGIIAFVEVKTRSENYLENGVDAVNYRKRRLIIRASQEYLYRIGSGCQPRFDISEVVLRGTKPVRFRYYDNAFDAGELSLIL